MVDLTAVDSRPAARAAGKIRSEGTDDAMRDAGVIELRWAPTSR